jgi:hypothetical protein
VKVGSVLIVDKNKIQALFKQIQSSFAELFFHSRLLYRELEELELILSFFKVKIQFMK